MLLKVFQIQSTIDMEEDQAGRSITCLVQASNFSVVLWRPVVLDHKNTSSYFTQRDVLSIIVCHYQTRSAGKIPVDCWWVIGGHGQNKILLLKKCCFFQNQPTWSAAALSLDDCHIVSPERGGSVLRPRFWFGAFSLLLLREPTPRSKSNI